jgi:hypothetical protein
VQIINEALTLLPDRNRRNPAEFKCEFLTSWPVADMNEHDPSEALGSAEVAAHVRGLYPRRVEAVRWHDPRHF